jgi:hypothetical protein
LALGIRSLEELRGKALRYEYDHVSKRGQAVVVDVHEDDPASTSEVSDKVPSNAEAVLPSPAQQVRHGRGRLS